MFELSWGEIALIGIVALVVIGPKELPGLLRGIGQTLAKVRRMASDFQYQFNQALQEAEVDKVKSSIDTATDGMRSGTSFNPIDYAREQIKSAVDGTKDTPAGSPPADVIGPPAPGTAAAEAAADPLASAIPAPPTYTADASAIQRAFAPAPIEPPAGFASAVAKPAAPAAPLELAPPAPPTPAPATDIKPAEDAAEPAPRPGKTPA